MVTGTRSALRMGGYPVRQPAHRHTIDIHKKISWWSRYRSRLGQRSASSSSRTTEKQSASLLARYDSETLAAISCARRAMARH